jgi:hypothetical protein
MSTREMLESLRNRWSEFFGSLRTQMCAAFAVGLPVDEAREEGESGAGQEGDDGPGWGRSAARASAGRFGDDAPGYMTRNGLGSLEVGAFRDRTCE